MGVVKWLRLHTSDRFTTMSLDHHREGSRLGQDGHQIRCLPFYNLNIELRIHR